MLLLAFCIIYPWNMLSFAYFTAIRYFGCSHSNWLCQYHLKANLIRRFWSASPNSQWPSPHKLLIGWGQDTSDWARPTSSIKCHFLLHVYFLLYNGMTDPALVKMSYLLGLMGGSPYSNSSTGKEPLPTQLMTKVFN